MARFGAPSVTSIIKQVEEDDASLTTIDLSSNTIFQMKPDEKCEALCAALAKNTHVTSLKLKDCGLGDKSAGMLAKMLSTNSTIVDIDLSKNSIKKDGAVALAEGVASNKTLMTLNLFEMPAFQRDDLIFKAFITMYDTNMTLTKIGWETHHQLAVKLAKLMTRNNEIRHCISLDQSFEQWLPDDYKGKGVVVLGRVAATGAVATDDDLAKSLEALKVSDAAPAAAADAAPPAAAEA